MFFSHVIRVTYPNGHSVRPIRIYTLKNPIFESGRFLILFKLANTDLMPIFDKKYSTFLSQKFRGVTIFQKGMKVFNRFKNPKSKFLHQTLL